MGNTQPGAISRPISLAALRLTLQSLYLIPILSFTHLNLQENVRYQNNFFQISVNIGLAENIQHYNRDVQISTTKSNISEKCDALSCTRIGIAQTIKCLTMDWTTGVRSPAETKDFSSRLCIQTSCGAHLVPHPVGTGGLLPGGKARPGHNADYSPPSSVEVKNEQEQNLSPHKRLHGV
jgi:hypothetical protein